MTAGGDSKPLIGVVGLWHLGCTIAACWAELGHVVRGVDRDEVVVGGLRDGRPPLFEPGLAEAIRTGLDCDRLSFSTAVETLAGCRFVFVAHDTPVRDDDTSDLSVIEETMARMAPHVSPGTIVVVSAQLPAGTARVFRSRLKQIHESLELVYSPENLRLGEALACYPRPGHIVIGADSESAAGGAEQLIASAASGLISVSVPSGEMAQHAINTELAASIK